MVFVWMKAPFLDIIPAKIVDFNTRHRTAAYGFGEGVGMDRQGMPDSLQQLWRGYGEKTAGIPIYGILMERFESIYDSAQPDREMQDETWI